MDCNCNCFGVATAARVPVKRYNLLVPDVFPVVEPPFEKPLGITIERKIKKLAEYLDKNEHRAPKVSRRLQRRLYKELMARNYGYVKLAVATYDTLLLSSRPEKSNLLANELVVRTVVKRRTLPFGHKVYVSFREPHLGSVVGLLLTQPSPALRKLGVDLLINFIKCQVRVINFIKCQHTSDYVPQLEAFVPLLCTNAKPHAAATPSGRPGSASAPASPRRTRSASSALAAVVAEEEAWAQLRAACLRALLEHLRFCARLSYVSYHLHTITFAVLECVDASAQALQGRQYSSPRAMLGQGLNPVESFTRTSISHAVAASPPDVAALLVFEELAHMTRDAAEGKKVLEFVMRFLDRQGRWLGSPVAGVSIAVMQAACEQEHQRYLLFSTLLRHVAVAEQLSPAERAAVLRLAVEESGQLEPGLAAPALLLALRELPAVIASHAGAGEEVPPMPPLPPVPPPATPALGAQLAAAAEGPAGAAEQAGQAPKNGTAAGGTAAAASAAGSAAGAAPGSLQQLELATLRGAPNPAAAADAAAAAAAAAAARGAPVDLQPQVLAAVQQLAVRVEDSGQLLEAIGSTVTKLRGQAPISTAALQCCVAAGQAAQNLAPRSSRGGSSVPRFSSLLLQELAGITVAWGPQQRLLAHQLLLQLLPLAVDGLREQQASVLLSAAWHEAALGDSPPAAYVALDSTLRALLGAAPAASLPQVVKMLAALQTELLQAGAGSPDDSPSASPHADGLPATDASRLAELTPAQACALLCVCASVLHALAAQLGQPALQQLAVPGAEGVLQQLACVPPHGLVLQAAGGSSGAAAPLNGSGPEAAVGQQQFWQRDAMAVGFSAEEQQRAAAFLVQWRLASSTEAQQASLAAALAAVPLFKQQHGGSGAFRPMPLSSLTPRMQQGALALSLSNGSHTSAGEGESRRAQRLRNVYRHMRQISITDGDRISLATISQESAADEPPVAGLRALGLEGEQEGDNGAKLPTVDDVLAEVDAALKAAEAAVANGRTPSPPAWASPSLRYGGSPAGADRSSPSPSTSVGSMGQAARPAAPRAPHLSSLR